MLLQIETSFVQAVLHFPAATPLKPNGASSSHMTVVLLTKGILSFATRKQNNLFNSEGTQKIHFVLSVIQLTDQ